MEWRGMRSYLRTPSFVLHLMARYRERRLKRALHVCNKNSKGWRLLSPQEVRLLAYLLGAGQLTDIVVTGSSMKKTTEYTLRLTIPQSFFMTMPRFLISK